MDHSKWVHSFFIGKLGAIAAALLVFLSKHTANAHGGRIREVSSAGILSFHHPISGRKLLEGGSSQSSSLKLSLLHRHELEPHAVSTLKSRIADIIQMDEMRVMGFSTALNKAKDHAHTPSDVTPFTSPAPAPATSKLNDSHALSRDPEHKEFEGRVISGASFPGNIGQYFVEFYVGTPGQRFLFIMDTGSDLIWVPCSLCKECSSPSPSPSSSPSGFSSLSSSPPSSFFPEGSSTFTPISCSSHECTLVPPPLDATCSARTPTICTYAYGYSDLSQTTGIFAYDTISMRSSTGSTMEVKNVALGCGTNNTGPSITKVGGVIGLGQGPISFSSQVGHMYGKKFSYCFTSFFHRKSQSALVFGEDRAGMELRSPLQFTPFLKIPIVDTFYHLQILKIKVGGEPLPIQASTFEIDKEGNGGVVIDSGTTLTFFLKPAYDVIIEAFKKEIKYPRVPSTAGLHLCYNITNINKPTFPRIAIIFKGGAIFRPPPRNYFLSPTPETRCLGIMASAGLSVLGNLIQQNYYVEYDRLNNKLGFAKANCTTSS